MLKIPFLSGNNFTKNKVKPYVLLVLDGFGTAPPSDGNAISLANTPNMDRYKREYAYGELIASGESVGLPAGEEGNSEVGHLTIGAGRVIYQSLKRINVSIEEEDFFENRAFLSAIRHARKNNSKLHIMGLASKGSVHSDIDHLYALLELCKMEEFYNVYLHLFTDGRDAPPQAGIEVIKEVQQKLQNYYILGHIASISGRYYAMDRDTRWQRIKKAYDAIVLGKGLVAASAVEAVKSSYQRGETDEFVQPTVIPDENGNPITVDDNDSVIFFNFRVDRARQLAVAFVDRNFEQIKEFEVKDDEGHGAQDDTVVKTQTFKREKWPKNVFFVTMTEYQKGLPVSGIAFPPEVAESCMTEMVAKKGLSQLHLTESEKVKMVTFYMNGGRQIKFPGEDDVIVPSPKVATYDKKPEMSVYDVVKGFKKALSKDKYHFFVMNFANPDMVAHSGDLDATIQAIQHIDKAVSEVVRSTLQANGTVFITADHGNAEELITYPTASFYYTTSKGEVNTDHSVNPVPFYIITNKLKGKSLKLPKGALSDVAPTILGSMGINIPTAMTGKDLLSASVPETGELEARNGVNVKDLSKPPAATA